MFPSQIRVNSVNPTVVMTELGKKCWQGEKAAAVLNKIPLKKFAGKFRVWIKFTLLFLAQIPSFHSARNQFSGLWLYTIWLRRR